jgi:septal ring factor EnvC (AmiA/AmiB activator)
MADSRFESIENDLKKYQKMLEDVQDVTKKLQTRMRNQENILKSQEKELKESNRCSCQVEINELIKTVDKKINLINEKTDTMIYLIAAVFFLVFGLVFIYVYEKSNYYKLL